VGSPLCVSAACCTHWAHLVCACFCPNEQLADVASQASIPLFIQLPGSSTNEGLDFSNTHVYHIKDAIIAKFKLLQFAPQQLLLFLLGDAHSSRVLLDPSLTLSEACIRSGSRLAVELSAPVSAFMAPLVVPAAVDGT
jgi:hypothetical protein